MQKNLKLASLFFAVSALLAGCGGGIVDPSIQSSPRQPSTKVQLFNPGVAGTWVPDIRGGNTYEFYSGMTEAPYVGGNTGRVYNAGTLKNFFSWEIQTNGSMKMKQYSPECATRPLTQCAVTGTATIAATGESLNSSHWRIEFDDNADGVVDRNTADFFTHKDLELSTMAEGEFFLTRNDLFELASPGKITGKKISIRVGDFVNPILLTGDVVAGKHASVKLTAGDPVVLPQPFTIPGVGRVNVPVRFTIDKAEIMAAANGGFILEYDLQRKILFPGPIDPSLEGFIAGYEKAQRRSRSMGLIDKFIPGPKIQAGDKYSTLIQLGFNPAWVALGGGNEITFTSLTDGVVAHHDFNKGKFSESRNFKWVQRASGEIVLTFENKAEGTIRFAKPIHGGYKVLFKLPHPTLGDVYGAHDMFSENPGVVAEKDVPGRYSFSNSDGVSLVTVTLHKDKTVSGIVGGFWFMDTNGDVVSYECRDLQGKLITSYAECEASFSTDFSKVSNSHIRRFRFMHKEDNNYLVKYNANFWGERWGVLGPDYFTIAWTYRWTRLGDE